jgi:16S rRNA (uracil1498-N3)-methyltransferase
LCREPFRGRYNILLARRRFFVEAIHSGAAELRGEEARHLTRVLRAEPGQLFELSDNQSAWLAEITEARGERVTFRVVEPIASPPRVVGITLCAALIKFDRFEWMVEKTTELGVSRILPVETARSEKGLLEASRKRQERWVRIAREAGQQSRRVTIPEILPAVRFPQVLGTPGDARYFLEEAGAPPLLRALPEHRSNTDEVSVLLGPEGGWTDAERQAAGDSGWLPASLGPTVLRAETAAAAVLAVLVNAWIH